MALEKDIGKIAKNDNTDVIVRIDDFGGKIGLTIREFVNGNDGGYKGFTKSGTRIPAEKFLEFRELINSVSLEDLKASEASVSESKQPIAENTTANSKTDDSDINDY